MTPDIIHIMRKNIYNLVLNRTGSPPKCKNPECKKPIIKVGDKYVHKNTRLHINGAFYCYYCAKEKSVI